MKISKKDMEKIVKKTTELNAMIMKIASKQDPKDQFELMSISDRLDEIEEFLFEQSPDIYKKEKSDAE